MKYSDIAENIIDYFSEDARFCWPCRRGVSKQTPSKVVFKFNNERTCWARALDRIFRSLLKQPYTYHDEDKVGAPLLIVENEVETDAIILFKEEERDGDKGLKYKVYFTTYEEVFTGWFSLCEHDE